MSLGQQIKGRWREFRREPSAFFFVVFMPVLWMLILGFAFSGGTREIYSVGWTALDDGQSAELPKIAEAALKADPRIKLTVGYPETLSMAQRRGDVVVTVGVAKGEVSYTYDAANRDAVRARDVANGIIQQALGRHDPVRVSDSSVAVLGNRYVDFLVPGLLALSIMTSSLFGTGMVIVANRRENLLKRYLATPMRPLEYIVSHIIGRGFILVVEMGALLIAAFLIFRFVPEGSLLDLVLFATLGAASFTAIAMLFASRTSNMAVMNGMTNLVSLPMMIVAGVWFSRANFPEWMASAARVLPLTALVDGLRRIALEGASLHALQTEIALLLAYLVVCTLGAKVLFKWY